MCSKPFTIWAISSFLIVIFNILLDILIIKTMLTTKRLFNHFSTPSFYYQSNAFTFICGSTLPPQESSYRPILLHLFSHFSFYNWPTSTLIWSNTFYQPFFLQTNQGALYSSLCHTYFYSHFLSRFSRITYQYT